MRRARRARRLTLQRLADEVGCAKSYLWLIEQERRDNPPGDELLRALEDALGLPAGRLFAAARWQETPGEVRREMSALKETERAAARLAGILRAGGSLDGAYRSGELKRLVERLGGDGAGRERDSETAKQGRESSKFKGQSSKAAARQRDSETAKQGRGKESSKFKVQSSRAGRDASFWQLGATALEVPLINKVAAGYPTEFTDLGYPVSVADEYIRCPDLDDPDAFAARVVGDSMMPEYREGDIVVFSPARAVSSGMDCFARIEPDHQSTFKRAYFEKGPKGEELIRLQPLNPAYPARTLPREDVAGLFAAVSVMRPVNRAPVG